MLGLLAGPRTAQSAEIRNGELNWSNQEALEWRAEDNPLTPTMVLRWISNQLLNTPLSLEPPRAEFKPTVNVNPFGYRLIACIAYRF